MHLTSAARSHHITFITSNSRPTLKGSTLTRVSQITSSGPGQLGFGTVVGVRVILIGEKHDPFVAQPDSDIAEQIGAGPERFAQRVVSIVAKGLAEKRLSFLSPVLVQL